MREQSKLRMCSALYISQYREANEDWRGTLQLFNIWVDVWVSICFHIHTPVAIFCDLVQWEALGKSQRGGHLFLPFDLLVYMCTSSCNNCTFFVPNCEVNFAVQGKWVKGRRGGALEPFPFPPNQATYPIHPSLSHFPMSELQPTMNRPPAGWELFHGQYITNIQMNYLNLSFNCETTAAVVEQQLR